jgi:hypothetical protein
LTVTVPTWGRMLAAPASRPTATATHVVLTSAACPPPARDRACARIACTTCAPARVRGRQRGGRRRCSGLAAARVAGFARPARASTQQPQQRQQQQQGAPCYWQAGRPQAGQQRRWPSGPRAGVPCSRCSAAACAAAPAARAGPQPAQSLSWAARATPAAGSCPGQKETCSGSGDGGGRRSSQRRPALREGLAGCCRHACGLWPVAYGLWPAACGLRPAGQRTTPDPAPRTLSPRRAPTAGGPKARGPPGRGGRLKVARDGTPGAALAWRLGTLWRIRLWGACCCARQSRAQ